MSDTQNGIKRLNWGCGHSGAPGWINSDVKSGEGIDIRCDILSGLPLESDSMDYVVSIHALPMIPYPNLVSVLNELRRVLKPDGVLRLGLPDIEKGMKAYMENDREYFLIPDDDVKSRGGKFIVQMIWYGYTRTLFTFDFIEELLAKAGFRSITECRHKETRSPYPEIVDLDNRERESLFVEAVK